MRIHTNTLTVDDIRAALPAGVYDAVLEEKRSRSHVRAFEIRLGGNGRRMQGFNCDGATWDEWGVFIARVFDRDGMALFGGVANPIYDGADDFHWQTGERFFDAEMPEDTHKQHRWEYVGELCTGAIKHRCSKCSAVIQRH